MKRGFLWIFVVLGVLAFANGYVQSQSVPRDPVAGNVAATPVTSVFSGANTASQAITLAGVANKTTYICGFQVSGLGATAATPVILTIASLAPGVTWSQSYVYAAGATVVNTPIGVQFSMCMPASASGAAITITVPGAAGNTATQINAHGYQL